MESNQATNSTINFETETRETLSNRGITSCDFAIDFCGSSVIATLVDHIDGCGEAKQDGMIFELTGNEGCRYALLTNGETIYSDFLTELRSTGENAS